MVLPIFASFLFFAVFSNCQSTKLYVSVDGGNTTCTQKLPCNLIWAMKQETHHYIVHIYLSPGIYDVKAHQFPVTSSELLITGNDSIITTQVNNNNPIFYNQVNPLNLTVVGVKFQNINRIFFNTAESRYNILITLENVTIHNATNHIIALWYSSLKYLKLNGVQIINAGSINKVIFIVDNVLPITFEFFNVYFYRTNGIVIHSGKEVRGTVKNICVEKNDDESFEVSSDLNLEIMFDSCIFINNEDSPMKLLARNINVIINNCSFTGNYGDSLAIVHIRTNSNIKANITNSAFTSNVIKHLGAIYYGINGVKGIFNIIHENNNFTKNFCESECIGGAAIIFERCITEYEFEKIDDIDEVYNNYGDNLIRLSGDKFVENSINTGYGGAVYFSVLEDATVDMKKCTFLGNYAGNKYSAYGGAISVSKPFKSFSLSLKNCLFDSNIATYGGSIFFDFPDKINFELDLDVRESKFQYNQAYLKETYDFESGGVFYFHSESVDVVMGAVNVTINEGSFVGNGGKRGGVFGNRYYPGVLFNLNIIDSDFISNTADYFGGVFYLKKTNINIQDTNFISNFARFKYVKMLPSDGGVFHVEDCVVNMTLENFFLENYALYRGGVFYTMNGSIIIDGDVDFDQSSADFGGFLYSEDIELFSITNLVNIFSSDANYGGAAFFVNFNILDIKGYISQNDAREGGGGIYFYQYPEKVNLDFVTDNRALNGNNVLTSPFQFKDNSKKSTCSSKSEPNENDNHKYECLLTGIDFIDYKGVTIFTETPFHFKIEISFEGFQLNFTSRITDGLPFDFKADHVLNGPIKGVLKLDNFEDDILLLFNQPPPQSIIWFFFVCLFSHLGL